MDAAAQHSAPLVGGPRSYYLSLFNDDTVLFDPSHYPPMGEAERVHQEQVRLRAAVEAVDEQKQRDPRSIVGAVRGAKDVGGRLPLLMQDSVLMEPVQLNRSNTISISRLLKEGVGFQPGDLSIGLYHHSVQYHISLSLTMIFFLLFVVVVVVVIFF